MACTDVASTKANATAINLLIGFSPMNLKKRFLEECKITLPS
jgi:hypothetical protein